MSLLTNTAAEKRVNGLRKKDASWYNVSFKFGLGERVAGEIAESALNDVVEETVAGCKNKLREIAAQAFWRQLAMSLESAQPAASKLEKGVPAFRTAHLQAFLAGPIW